MPIKKIEAGGKEILVACTEDEAKDKSYMDYIQEAQDYKAANEKPKEKEKPRYSREHVSGALKEYNDWKRETDNGLHRKYW